MPEFYFSNYIIGYLKEREIRIFVRIFRTNKGSLGVFRGALGVANFVVSGLYALNSISTIILLAIAKMAKLGFFFVFFEKISGVCGCSVVLLGVANFYVITLHALILFQQLYYWRSQTRRN